VWGVVEGAAVILLLADRRQPAQVVASVVRQVVLPVGSPPV